MKRMETRLMQNAENISKIKPRKNYTNDHAEGIFQQQNKVLTQEKLAKVLKVSAGQLLPF